MKKRVLALVICFVLLLALFVPITTAANENGYIVQNLSVSVFGYSYTNVGPYPVSSEVDAIAIRLNKQINPSYLSATTSMEGGLQPLELEYGFEETYGSDYFYWFYMPTNKGYIEFQIANGTNTPISYRVSIVY